MPPSAELSFSRPVDVVDFSKRRFDALVHDHEAATKIENFRAGYENTLVAKKLLVEAGTSNPTLWAFVIERKRVTTYELAMWAENIDCCRTAIDQMGDKSL